jgi:hypothetical protein
MKSAAARQLVDDPVLAAFLNAPVDDRPETEDERAAYEAAMAGPWLSHEEVMASIERRRLAEVGASEEE